MVYGLNAVQAKLSTLTRCVLHSAEPQLISFPSHIDTECTRAETTRLRISRGSVEVHHTGLCLLHTALYLTLWWLFYLFIYFFSKYAHLFSRISQWQCHCSSCWHVFVCLVTSCVISAGINSDTVVGLGSKACVYVYPEGCAKALISLLWSCCFLYLLASAKSVHPHTCSLTLISQAHTQLSISSARLEIMKVPSPGPNILLISVELEDDVSNYFDVKKLSLT